MNAVIGHDGGCAVVRLSGRLDGEAAQQLAEVLDRLLRDGQRSLLLDMEEVGYISSPGIQLLERVHLELSNLRGELRLRSPSPSVLDALTLADLRAKLLLHPNDTTTLTRLRTSAVMRGLDLTHDAWRSPVAPTFDGSCEIMSRDANAALACRAVGHPGAVLETGFRAPDCRVVDFPETAFGLGIGAIGRTYQDAAPRFGELVGAAGAVAYLPTDGALVPDFDLGPGGRAPVALLASGLVCDGEFAGLVRFSTEADVNAVSLTHLARVCLDAVGADTVGLVMLAETAGLVGAWLRRSPGGAAPGLGKGTDAVGRWLGTTPEPTHEGTTVLAAGIASRRPPPLLSPHLRRLGDPSDLVGHFHAVVFSYRPVPQRTVSLRTQVSQLFAEQRVRGVMHLLCDDRRGMGAGESAFRRGLCWTSPVSHVTGAA